MREVWCSFNCELLADNEALGVKVFWLGYKTLIYYALVALKMCSGRY